MENRKELILKEVVDQYIQTGNPVSSQILLEEYDLSLSSATIRNDMHALEQEGYLQKPYTSGGRIPTLKGYRYFVDWLIELSELSTEERKEIVNTYEFQRRDAEKLLRLTAMLLANITGYAGLVMAPNLEEAELENVTLVKLDQHHLMVIFVTEWGLVDNRIIQLDKEIPDPELNQISQMLNEKLRGRKLKEMNNLEKLNLEEGGWYDKLMRDSLLVVKEFLEEQLDRRLFFEGTLNLLESLENDTEEELSQLRKMLTCVHDQQWLTEIIENTSSSQNKRIRAVVGIEAGKDTLDYSLIAKRLTGCSSAIGVVGPVRMNYGRSFSAVQYIGNRLETLLNAGNNIPSRN